MMKIAEAAANARRNFPSSVAVDVKAIVRSYGIELEEFDFSREQGALSGVLVIANGIPSIKYNKKEPDYRQRFTIAHELGHFIMHKDKDIFVDTDFKVMFRSSSPDNHMQRQEREANEFAACLLMPEDLIRQEINVFADKTEEELVKELASRFKVSEIAMSIRLSRLGLFR